MKIAGILTIGDELLQGFTVNSNAAKISMILTKRNISVKIHLTVPDNIEKIKEKIDKFISKDYDFVIITGGLGPTHDDITKKALLELLTICCIFCFLFNNNCANSKLPLKQLFSNDVHSSHLFSQEFK